MRTELEYIFAALRFFTRLPVPAWVGHSPEQLNHAARYFSLVGILIGAIGAAVTWIAGLLWPPQLAILGGMIATILATGAFHEDGLADSIDGFGGGWSREQVLTIMKDSRVGSYGAVGIALALLLKFTVLGVLPTAVLFAALIAGHAASRFFSTTLIYSLDYARDDDTSKSKPLATRMSKGELALAAFFGLAPCLLLPGPKTLVALVLAALTTLLAARYFVKRIGGYTGDALGATQQLSELAFYLGLACVCTW
jgi:adenosylcobinamide-GDP ribazoletransferase